jgi:flagellar protein FliJ
VAGKFRFRLQPVLEQRERLEQEKQRRFAELERERLAAEGSLRRMQQDIQDAKLDLRARLGGAGGAVVIIPEVRAQASASLHMEARARQAAMTVAGAYRRVERARAELLQAATARKAVDLLREKRFEEWRQEQLHADAAQVDEAGTQLYVRKHLEEQGGEA